MTERTPLEVTANQRHYLIATDGACKGNPGIGGWGVFLQLKDGDQVLRKAAYAGYGGASNNIKMEMTAVARALSKLREPETPAIIVMDNKMIVEAMTLGWFENWKAADWRKGSKPRLNADLWQEIDQLLGDRPIHWVWTKGHAGDEHNGKADMLASNAALRKYQGEGRGVYAQHPGLFL